MKKYYHVTHINNFTNILDEGLKLNEDGQLFLFDYKTIAPEIAVNQCFLISYVLFMIQRIDESRLKPDNVGELTARCQWIYDQHIPSECIKMVGIYDIDLKAPKVSVDLKNRKIVNS